MVSLIAQFLPLKKIRSILFPKVLNSFQNPLNRQIRVLNDATCKGIVGGIYLSSNENAIDKTRKTLSKIDQKIAVTLDFLGGITLTSLLKENQNMLSYVTLTLKINA